MRQRRQHDQHREIDFRRRDVERLLAVAEAADEDAEAHESGRDDHDHSENGIAHQRRRRFASEHQRYDQRELDDRHGDRQHQRADRLAGDVRHVFGVVDGGEHSTDERRHQQNCRRNPDRVGGEIVTEPDCGGDGKEQQPSKRQQPTPDGRSRGVHHPVILS